MSGDFVRALLGIFSGEFEVGEVGVAVVLDAGGKEEEEDGEGGPDGWSVEREVAEGKLVSLDGRWGGLSLAVLLGATSAFR